MGDKNGASASADDGLLLQKFFVDVKLERENEVNRYLTMEEDANNEVAPVPSVDVNRPLWRYVTKQGRTSKGGGNQNFECSFCNGSYKGSYSRVKAHLLRMVGYGIKGCPKVTVGQINEMINLEDEALRRIESGRAKMIPFPHSSTSPSYSVPIDALSRSSFKQDTCEPRKRKMVGDNVVEKASNLEVKEQLDGEIARMFYAGGIPFNFARNPHFLRAFTFAAKANISGYVPPSYDDLRTKLLTNERTIIDGLLNHTRSTWRTKGASIVSNGWSDPQKRPLINFMAINMGGPVFISAVNNQGEYKDECSIYHLMKEVIMEVGVTNVIQVITDNVPVCKAAGMLIEETYPHIFWTPCVVHTLNLALENICAAKNTEANGITYHECQWITEVVGSALMIHNFIMNHSMRPAIYNKFPKIKLLAVAETRFASMIILLKRFKLVKHQLQSMVISEQWSCYREEDVAKAKLVKEKLLNDVWWDYVDYILTLTEPIYSMLRFLDTDKPCLHLVYEMWGSMMHLVKRNIYAHEMKSDGDESSFWNVVRIILEDRWSSSSNPLHCLAHSLNPRCTTKEWENEHPYLTPPRSDHEVSKMRKLCLKRLFPSEDTRREVNVEVAKFFGFLDGFAEEDSIRDRSKLKPIEWWLVYGSSAPHLQSLCIKLLGQVCSSSCCERNWSTYAFIHSTKRDQITSQCAEDLVYVHSNLRLLSRKTPQYMQGDNRMWDVAGDAFESLDDVGILAIANLSLDEPEFEAVLFADKGIK
ncbi:hypothetical protein ACJIZ3_017431 [Penstemon smallii]|uniref:BED-type domain-containing protein n=1 Tax=Penstemon smallii TaxID=265156 RepID=A0ABD3SVI7_9LAMI